MKNYTKILILLTLFSVVSSAQTKPTATKTSNVESLTKTNQKPASAKPTVKTTAKTADKTPPKTTGKTAAKTNSVAKAKPQPQVKQKQSNKQPAKENSKQAAKPIAVKNTKTSEKTETKSSLKSNVKPATDKLNVKPITKPLEKTIVKPVAKLNFDKGAVAGKTYTNEALNFEIRLPDEWLISDENFEAEMKKQGINLVLETPKAVNSSVQTTFNQAANRINILLTAYKVAPDANDNAILRVSVEDLRSVPQVKDAVDYFDLMRQTFRFVKLPPDFKYSETQAERLGKMQFGFLDTENAAGKKRMYATVRRGYALMFTLTYKSDEDLAALKDILAAGNFRLN